MRKVRMAIAEFYNFVFIAKSYGIHFSHHIKNSIVEVRAKDEDLIEIGY